MKRVFDFAVAAVLLILLLPILVMVAMVVWIAMAPPALFRQIRPGLRGRPFQLYKFRTMKDTVGPDGHLLPDAKRLTRIGTIIRRLSLDELPQLFNVIKGDMSLVGPRPLLMEYLPRYSPEQFRRHEVRPGITGWAQVNGRNAISWEERFRLDIWYVDHRSFLLDLKILCLTGRKVLARDGISAAGQVTMTQFMGSPLEGSFEPTETESNDF